MKSYTLKELAVGQKCEREFSIAEEDGQAFAQVSKDINPIHLDEEYAKKTRFGGKIVHGMLLGGYISSLIGTELPGEGSIYMKQELNFLRPVRYGDIIRVEIAVTELILEKKRAVLSTNCYNQKGEQVIEGMALVKPKEEK